MEILWINLWIEHKVNKGVNNKSILIWSLHIYCNCNNCFKLQFSSVAQSCLTAIPWTTACQASLSITNSWSLFKLMFIELVMPSNHFILCRPLLLLPSIFPSIRSFPVSRLFASGGQSIGASASASVLPMNIQGWLPLGLTTLISLQSKGSVRVFSVMCCYYDNNISCCCVCRGGVG